MKNQKNWMKHDLVEGVKSISRVVGLIIVVILPTILFLNASIWAVMIAGILGSVFHVFIILPKLSSKTLWKGTENFSEYVLIRVWGKFKLIKVGVFGNYTVIEDLNKDGVPDKKTERRFMGRFGYFDYPQELDELDYQAFITALQFVSV